MNDKGSGGGLGAGKEILKEVVKISVGCAVGCFVGYTLCHLRWKKWSDKQEIDLDKNEDVEEYIRREGNVYIKQLSDIRFTTMQKYPLKASKYLTPVSQCHFLKWLVSTMNVRKGIEIGTFTGSSSLCIGLGIKSVRQRDNLIDNNISGIATTTATANDSDNNNNNNNKYEYKLLAINDSANGDDDIMNNGNNMSDISNLDDLAADITSSFDKTAVYDEELAICEKAWKAGGVDDIISSEYCHEPYKSDSALLILSNLYSDHSNHNSFDFAFINNIADLTSLKEYYTLLMKLVKTNGIICINNTLFDGKVATQGVSPNPSHNNRDGKNNKNRTKKDKNDRHGRSGRYSNSEKYSRSVSMNLSMASIDDNSPKSHEMEILDRIRSFNNKIVSDSTDKLLIDCCMILMSNNHSMTLIRKLNRNVNESNSNLLQRK